MVIRLEGRFYSDWEYYVKWNINAREMIEIPLSREPGNLEAEGQTGTSAAHEEQ